MKILITKTEGRDNYNPERWIDEDSVKGFLNDLAAYLLENAPDKVLIDITTIQQKYMMDKLIVISYSSPLSRNEKSNDELRERTDDKKLRDQSGVKD